MQIDRRLLKYLILFLPILAALIVVYVLGMSNRWTVWVMVDGALLFAACCFAWVMYFYPCIRYRQFLNDMDHGLARQVEGRILEVSQTEELQDGVRVRPVRVFIDADQDERLVYLNVSKAEVFPDAGTQVKLNCYGRHIKEVSIV
jgi:hypothetical protein